MDLGAVIAGINSGLIVAFYLYVQNREDKLRGLISGNEKEVTDVKTNYNAKFLGVHEIIHQVEKNIIGILTANTAETRESNHRMREEVSKALNGIAMEVNTVKMELRGIMEARGQ